MRFIDCLNERSLILWAQLAKEFPCLSSDITIDTKLESLGEIDHLMRVVPGFDKEANND
jgi:hypothetical protein